MKTFPTYVLQRSRLAGSVALLISCVVVTWMSGAVAITAKGTAVQTLPRTQRFDDVEFDASQHRLTPFNLIANWIVLSVKINGRDYHMLLDSGAPNVISTSAAVSLGLDVEGRYTGWGVGKREITGGETTVSRLRIGNVVLHDQTFHVMALPYAFTHGFSPSIEGVIGYEVFRRLVVRVDFQRSTIRFLDPQSFHYHGKGVPVPFYLEEHVPVVAGTVDGLQGAFQIDTGSDGSLSVTSPFVARNDLVRRYSAHIRGFAGEGVGGRENAYFVRARVLHIGGADIPSVVTELLDDTGGVGAMQAVAGFIGTAVLKRFNLTFDYTRNTIYFEKNANYNRPSVFNRAGLAPRITPEGLKVVSIFEDSPAAAAGILPGDTILAINGHTGDQLNGPFLFDILRQPVGTVVRFTILHAGVEKSVQLKLRDLL
jgi:hypothetical protein